VLNVGSLQTYYLFSAHPATSFSLFVSLPIWAHWQTCTLLTTVCIQHMYVIILHGSFKNLPYKQRADRVKTW